MNALGSGALLLTNFIGKVCTWHRKLRSLGFEKEESTGCFLVLSLDVR